MGGGSEKVQEDMIYSVQILEEAENDIDNARDWYELQLENLGDSFYERIQSGINQIVKTPFSYREIYKGVRRYIVHKFPFGIYYLVDEESNTINITGIIHFKRSSRVWKKRI